MDFNLNWRFFIPFVFFSAICWQTRCSGVEKNVSLNLFVKVRNKIQNVFVKNLQSAWSKTNSIERKTGAERSQTARSEQNYRHVTKLICSEESNTGSSRSPREMINLTAISLSSGAASSHGHKNTIANVFSHCVKMLLGCFDYIVIFPFKISIHIYQGWFHLV